MINALALTYIKKKIKAREITKVFTLYMNTA